MSKVKFILIVFCLSLFFNGFSQKGKNAAKTVSVTNVKINEFTALTAPAAVNDKTITVAASSLNSNARFTSTLTPGDLVMIIQMQGALIKLKPYNPWEAYVTDSTYGQIYSYQTCGNYEFAEVKSVISSTQIEINCGLKYSYSSSGKTQIVRVPRYTSLNIASTGTLTTDAWNGTIGGVLVAEVDGNTTINSSGLISANGLGFRGGVAYSSGGNDFYPLSAATTPTAHGSEKGEGIGSNRLTNLVDSVGNYSKGAPGNGGGGGNTNNCGGGGGGNGGNIANYNGYGISDAGFAGIWDLEWIGRSLVTSSGGGKGGYGTSTTTTANINTTGPNNTAWGASFKRLNAGGFGGRPLDYSTGKLFMGGGGGAGHMTGGQSTNTGACSGGAGGGLIYLLNYGTISGTGTISANGSDGFNAAGTAVGVRGIDGAGGAGAGGTIILQNNGTISGITTDANGGNGGNQLINSPASTSEGQGPGGGGGGGYIAGNGSIFTQNVNGGANGTTNARAFDTEFPMNGATSGDIGTNNQIITPSFSLSASINQTICTNQTTTVTATSTNTNSTIEWYNSLSGNSIASGTVYTTPSYTAAGSYTVYAGSCPGIYRLPIIITVNTGATFSINTPTICPGESAVLTATTSASSYTWNTSEITLSISVTPTVTSIYTISSSNGVCIGSQTATVTVSSTPTISVPNATICSGTSTVLTASGSTTSYTWMPGSIVSPTISSSSNSNYTITGSNGTCTNSITATVTVASLPTVIVPNATICAGTSTVLTASGSATSFTWMPGSIITTTISSNSNSNYTITGSNATCTNSTTATVSVTSLPTISVSNATICSGTSTVLTISGTVTNYTWMPGSITTSTISANSNINYTITGSKGACTNSTTATVSVNSLPTVSVPNATICSGTSTVLTASGSATSFTWMPGSVISPTISANSNANYTVSGSDGVCTNTASSTVSVTPTPTLTGVSNTTICPAQTATFTAGGATSFTWQPDNFVGTTYTITPSSNTTISVTGANGICTTFTTVSITIGSNVSITVPGTTICPSQSATLTASSLDTYTWSTTANTNSIIVTPTSTTVYTVAGTIGTCAGSQTVEVTVIDQPTLAITGNTNICSGGSTTLTANGTATSYTWIPGSITPTISINPNTTTDYTITGGNGVCTNSIISTVSVTPTPTITGVSDTPICTGQTATFTAGGATSFTWQPNNFVGTTYAIAPSSNTTISVIGANGTCTSSTTASITIGSGASITVNSETICAGQTATLSASGITTYTWSTSSNLNPIAVSPTTTTTYTVSGNNGSCSGTQTATVTVIDQPTLAITGNTNICSGGSTTLTANGTSTSYTWQTTGQTTNTLSVNPNITTTYVVTGSNGVCTNSIISTVSVTPTPTISVNSPSICVGQTATLTASGATSFTWNTTETTATINPSPVLTTTYSGSGFNGTCSSSFTATVAVDNTTLTTNSIAVATCPSQTVTLFGTGTNTATTTYTWNNGINSYSQTVAPINTTTYVVNGTSLSGCTALSGTVIVNVNSISANFSGLNTTIMTVGETLNLTDISTGATSIEWDYCDGVSAGNQITIPLSDVGTCCIKLVATNASCKDSITKCVNIVNEAAIIIPNVFTPNGDTKNDLFKIHSVGVKSLNCTIYDRWGLKLYEWDGINGFWDGSAKGGLAPCGTYFYIINYNDEKDKSTTEKGFLTLFKD